MTLLQVLAVGELIAAIAVLGGVSAGVTIRWLDERDRRRPSDSRPTSYAGATPVPVPAPPPPAPFMPPPVPSNAARLELMRPDWVHPRRPL